MQEEKMKRKRKKEHEHINRSYIIKKHNIKTMNFMDKELRKIIT